LRNIGELVNARNVKKRKSCTKEYQEKERKSTQSFKKEKRIK